MAKVKLQCSAHESYQGLAAPRGDCVTCWKIYATRLKMKLKEKNDNRKS